MLALTKISLYWLPSENLQRLRQITIGGKGGSEVQCTVVRALMPEEEAVFIDAINFATLPVHAPAFLHIGFPQTTPTRYRGGHVIDGAKDTSWFYWDETPTLQALHEKFLRDLTPENRKGVIDRRPIIIKAVEAHRKALQIKAGHDLDREKKATADARLNEGRDILTDEEYLAAKRRADDMRLKGEW